MLLALAGKVRRKEMEEQKEVMMSSAYMSRLQYDVQLSNLYFNHGCFMSLKDDLDK